MAVPDYSAFALSGPGWVEYVGAQGSSNRTVVFGLSQGRGVLVSGRRSLAASGVGGTSSRRVGVGGKEEAMGEHHHTRRLSSRSRLAPAGACPSPTTPSPVALAEVPTGVPSPCVPPRGSWRTPAAASVKGRSSRPATVSRRRAAHPATAAVATSRSALRWTNHSSMPADAPSKPLTLPPTQPNTTTTTQETK